MKELCCFSRNLGMVAGLLNSEFGMNRNDAQPSRVQCEVLAHGFMDGIEK